MAFPLKLCLPAGKDYRIQKGIEKEKITRTFSFEVRGIISYSV